MTVLYGPDAFTATNGTAALARPPWTVNTGTWVVASNQMSQSGAFGANVIRYSDTISVDQWIEADIVAVDSNVVLTLRFTNTNNDPRTDGAYTAEIATTGAIAVYRGGTYLAGAAALAFPYTLRFEVEGEQVRLYRNAVSVVNLADTGTTRLTGNPAVADQPGAAATSLWDNVSVGDFASASTFTATLAATIGAPVADLNGTATPPVFTATIDATVPAPSANLTGTATPPAFTGTLAATIDAPTGDINGTFVPPPIVGTIAATIDPPTANLNGTATPPVFTATMAATVPAPSANINGTVTPPQFTATIAATIPAPVADINGTFTVPNPTATLTAIIPASTANLSGVVTVPTFTGTIFATVDAPTANLNGFASGGPSTPPFAAGAIRLGLSTSKVRPRVSVGTRSDVSSSSSRATLTP